MFVDSDHKPIKLSPLELRVISLIRTLGPFDKLEVRVDKQTEIVVELKSTLRESFPIDRRK